MSRENNTPISIWLDMPVIELGKWIVAHNKLNDEMKKPRR